MKMKRVDNICARDNDLKQILFFSKDHTIHHSEFNAYYFTGNHRKY